MKNFVNLLLCTLLVSVIYGDVVMGVGTKDGSKQWGYVQARPKAHMFWWHYKSPFKVDDPSKPWPIILWLQGGLGGSGVGIGNFKEIGPLDNFLNPRNSTWLKKADILFVDNPVGSGYSYVEDDNAYVKTDEAATTDLTTLMRKLFNKNEQLQKSPLYVLGESYGGKFVVALGLSVVKAIKTGHLKLKFGGFSWGPLLKDLSRLDNNGLAKSRRLAQKIKRQIEAGKFVNATDSWADVEEVIFWGSNSVDFYNFMLDSTNDPSPATVTSLKSSKSATSFRKYSTYLEKNITLILGNSHTPGGAGDLDTFMDVFIRAKLKIIPKNVTWGGQSWRVFTSLSGDFMKPRINEVDQLLKNEVNVTVYNGQVDLICATKGTEAWVEKLKWGGLKSFLSLDRKPLTCENDTTTTKGFFRSYKNLHFYRILGAGYFVTVDQPCVSLQMIGDITQSPN
ncbi:hypothetical protein MKW92_000909 [Papaver armeniacum]|nr:hypothetical protein MKW92_000909 [Papaver armeniacum]